ncbi:protein EMSY-LIKE 3-like isoform X4 [Syzygium oleosum]|uniref:protein EMSY-LIKE 3-like isoform X4 n=1 Tax=Syzygium oleosum TaxID=219896 RepID=UPI0024B92EFC|nr:protein EMSY-LIKE 3-like isoform X4 [Syzygium oleosum]
MNARLPGRRRRRREARIKWWHLGLGGGGGADQDLAGFNSSLTVQCKLLELAMDYEPYDSSGTDDDLPPSHQNRIPRGGHLSGNGRAGFGGSLSYQRMYAETDMESQIHQLEREAYSAVLRAFKAQSDAITWEKESLITELRKELRLSNEEHRELLSQVNADDVLRRIREWRKAVKLQQGDPSTGQGLHDPTPSPSVSVSRKKQKIAQPLPSGSSQPLAGPPSSYHPQPKPAPHQPSSSAAKRGPIGGTKSRKHNVGQALPVSSSTKSAPYPAAGPSGRGQVSRTSTGAHLSEPAETANVDQLIGQKVRTRWPDDNNFYEAVIYDYNPAEGLHALVYDKGTPNETWEWVNLSEVMTGQISPEDIQWMREDPGVSHRGNHAVSGSGMNRPMKRENVSGGGKGRGALKNQSKKEHRPFQNGLGKKGPDIQIRNTGTLLKEVEKVFSTGRPDPLEMEEAKKVLREHERALVDAIARLADISDGEQDKQGDQFLRGRPVDR